MRPVRKFVWICAASALLALSSVSTAAADGGNGERGSVKLLLGDLSSPKGLAVNAQRDLVIAQGAFGAPGPILVFYLHGPNKGTAVPITDPFNIIDVAVSPLDGTGWAIGDGHLFHRLADGTIVDVISIVDYQAGDPDPVDHDDPPDPTDSNPYGLTVMRNGDALVADAGGNDVVRVTPDGEASTVARFDLQSINTDHLPADVPGGPRPPTFLAESVPTTVTIGPDGASYVGELKGFGGNLSGDGFPRHRMRPAEFFDEQGRELEFL